MKQRALDTSEPLHVAIIMDGNGRWAEARGRPRTAGHRAGATAVRRVIEAAERTTAAGTVLRLRLAIDYSSRDAIVQAAAAAPRSRAELTRCLEPAAQDPAPDVDLMIRTGGEQRLSDFLLWESAYAELYFMELPCPDFDAEALAAAVAEYGRRQRRFGGLETMARTAAVAS